MRNAVSSVPLEKPMRKMKIKKYNGQERLYTTIKGGDLRFIVVRCTHTVL